MKIWYYLQSASTGPVETYFKKFFISVLAQKVLKPA